MLEPLPRRQWNRVAAAHLLNRAGFGATPAEIEAAAQRPHAEVVAGLVDYPRADGDFQPPSWYSEDAKARPDRRDLRRLPEEERRKMQQESRRQQQDWLKELRAWWLNRMRSAAQPLQEKLTLFWHGHFATSAEKVRSTYCLYAQNQLFRQHANGNWRDLLIGVAKDPAMLIYLDNAQSRKEHPNENFARELMELFTLGEGNYTEEDIQEAARAFTGWTLHPDRFEFIERSRMHDDGHKSCLGQSGRLTGGDIVDAILRRPQAARFIARKIWTFFASENPDSSLVDALAGVLTDGRYELKPLLTAMFLSREFYAEDAMGTQIKSPVQWLVGMCRILEAPLPDPDESLPMLRALGQELFAPPNVKGWDGGYAWISTTRLLNRYNLAGVFVKGARGAGADRMGGRMGELRRMQSPVDADRVLPAADRRDRETAQDSLQRRLYQRPVRDKSRRAISEYLGRLPAPDSWRTEDIREILHLMMSTPEFQLC
jgi:uncharacterized protein (DUF1800 family)